MRYRMDQQVCPVETPQWKPPMVGFHLKKGKPTMGGFHQGFPLDKLAGPYGISTNACIDL